MAGYMYTSGISSVPTRGLVGMRSALFGRNLHRWQRNNVILDDAYLAK
jgi:hypothetical protein